MISIIVATDNKFGFGKDGKIPWHYPEDFKFFKETTKEKTLIMGRKTFESLPKVLPGRKHLVLTGDINFTVSHPDVEIIKEIDSKIVNDENAILIGGSQLINAHLLQCNYLYLTVVDHVFEGPNYVKLSDNLMGKLDIYFEMIEGFIPVKEDKDEYKVCFFKYVNAF